MMTTQRTDFPSASTGKRTAQQHMTMLSVEKFIKDYTRLSPLVPHRDTTHTPSLTKTSCLLCLVVKMSLTLFSLLMTACLFCPIVWRLTSSLCLGLLSSASARGVNQQTDRQRVTDLTQAVHAIAADVNHIIGWRRGSRGRRGLDHSWCRRRPDCESRDLRLLSTTA